MSTLTYVDLYSGIGGASLAAESAGLRVVAHAEIDPFCCRVLHKHWPSVPNIGDVDAATPETLRRVGVTRIDVLHCSPPCQALSHAGKRKGVADPRYKWPSVVNLLRALGDSELRPTVVTVENAPGVVGLVLDDWLADLGSLGYAAVPLAIPAAAVGAPHLRERIFVVAYTEGERRELWQAERAGQGRPAGSGTGPRLLEHAGSAGRTEREPATITGDTGLATGGCDAGVGQADTTSVRQSGRAEQPRRGRPGSADSDAHDGGVGATEPELCRDAPGLPAGLDGAGLMSHQWPALMGQAQYPHEPPRVVTAKLPHRRDRLKSLGNAICPQQAYPIFAAIYAVLTEQAA